MDMLSFNLTGREVKSDALQSFADASKYEADLARDYVSAHHEFIVQKRSKPTKEKNCFYHCH